MIGSIMGHDPNFIVTIKPPLTCPGHHCWWWFELCLVLSCLVAFKSCTSWHPPCALLVCINGWRVPVVITFNFVCVCACVRACVCVYVNNVHVFLHTRWFHTGLLNSLEPFCPQWWYLECTMVSYKCCREIGGRVEHVCGREWVENGEGEEVGGVGRWIGEEVWF